MILDLCTVVKLAVEQNQCVIHYMNVGGNPICRMAKQHAGVVMTDLKCFVTCQPCLAKLMRIGEEAVLPVELGQGRIYVSLPAWRVDPAKGKKS